MGLGRIGVVDEAGDISGERDGITLGDGARDFGPIAVDEPGMIKVAECG